MIISKSMRLGTTSDVIIIGELQEHVPELATPTVGGELRSEQLIHSDVFG